MGHNIASAVVDRDPTPPRGPNGERLLVPQGWQQAAAADASTTTDYGSHHINEDFAEAWMLYVQARRTGTMDDFRRKFPNRAPILDQIFQMSLQ